MFIPSLLNLSGVVCLQTDRHESKRNKVKEIYKGNTYGVPSAHPCFPVYVSAMTYLPGSSPSKYFRLSRA